MLQEDKNLFNEIPKPKVSGNLVDLFPCLQPPEVREKLSKESQVRSKKSQEKCDRPEGAG